MPRREILTNPWPKSDDLTYSQSRERSLAMTHESMHALEVRIHNLDRKLSLYPIGKLAKLTPYCMLTRE